MGHVNSEIKEVIMMTMMMMMMMMMHRSQTFNSSWLLELRNGGGG